MTPPWNAFLPFKIMPDAIPQPSEAQPTCGHELTALIREVEASVSAWADEVTAASPLQVEVQRYADSTLASLQLARVELGVLGQVMAQAGGS
jgi:hypothetical protein